MPNHVAPNQGATTAMKMPAVWPGPQPGDATGQQVIACVSFIENNPGSGIMMCPVDNSISFQLASLQCWGVVKIW